MQNYIQIYLKYFGIGEQDVIQCEKCGRSGRIDYGGYDFHHINGRGKGMDKVENIILLCRNCHNHAHSSKEYISKQEFQEIHDKFLKRHG